MFNSPKIIESRRKAAQLIRRCLYEGYLVREALKNWPDYYEDQTLLCARHALVHFEVDKEVYRNDKEYFEQQVEWMQQLVNILSTGEAIPANIIESYEEYYELPVSLKTSVLKFISRLFYPVVNGALIIAGLFRRS